VKPSVGVPVPVPDAEVSPEQTIATQTEMSQSVSPVTEGTGDEGFGIEKDIVIEDSGPPADFVPVEKEPQIIKQVKPNYPELAMRAGLEGKVWVKIWVDKEGKPRDVVILKSDAEIFNEPAIAAARQFLFTPAYMNNGPVDVWVSVPFNFKLADRN
jgi:protein TonB